MGGTLGVAGCSEGGMTVYDEGASSGGGAGTGYGVGPSVTILVRRRPPGSSCRVGPCFVESVGSLFVTGARRLPVCPGAEAGCSVEDGGVRIGRWITRGGRGGGGA